MNGCILLSAGIGERFGGKSPKQYEMFHGKQLFQYTLDVIEAMPFIHEIALVVHPEYMERMEDCISDKVFLVAGGKTRQQSVNNGLSFIESDKIMIHETVRPLITESQALAGFDALDKFHGASYYTDVIETLVFHDEDRIAFNMNRNQFKLLQCPQFFITNDLKLAHEKFKDESFTDDTGILREYGGRIKLLKGGPNLTKVTIPEDLLYLSCL